MGISVFVSRPTPHEHGQQVFLRSVLGYLDERGLAARTIGETDYGRTPMSHIRSVMRDCNGLLGLALRRFKIIDGEDRPGARGSHHSIGRVKGQWLTSPYLHLEAAIAYSLGLPILLATEVGVIAEGALESGVLQMYPPIFDTRKLSGRTEFLGSQNWQQLIQTWEGEVREVSRNKGLPPRLYGP